MGAHCRPHARELGIDDGQRHVRLVGARNRQALQQAAPALTPVLI
jgi:hypothetical protein